MAEFDHGLAEDILPVGRCSGLDGQRGAGGNIIRSEAVELLRVLERRLVAVALLGQHMDDNGPVAGLGELQRADQQGEIVPVNRAQVAQPHLLEDQAAAISAAAIK